MTRVIAAIGRFLVRTGFHATPEQSDYLSWADVRLDQMAAELHRSRQAHPMHAGLDRDHDAYMGAFPFQHSYVHPGPQDCRTYRQCHDRAYGVS